MCTATWNIPSSSLAASPFPSSPAPCQEDEQWTWCISLVPRHLLPLSFFGTLFFFLLELSSATDHTQYFWGGKERRFDLGLLTAVFWEDPCLTLEDRSYHHLSSLNVRLPHLCNFMTLKMTKKGGFFPLSVGRVILFFQNQRFSECKNDCMKVINIELIN